ncbi:ABC transporter ATP-binding protein [Prodigiosinella confusarubida]|uniref:ABC transporter ATP-binding protein n=1 Tax=Serratia sp. (strain ATCC 39006) TaxID=104623 RepID=A0A2I5TGD2_SERS3|nr:ABC transporter ATP-binding protein [Serratia sp. ATCC 39006]AUG99317.1 ABC transporter ATP-binding protein [Serratia sp. ATCC 39006]AUH03635.1 ABC transporter ATP-binding protein [Serratia sp. ATCC 39006]
MQRAHDTDLIRLENITHAYTTGASNQAVLHDVSFSVPAGQSCAIVGASGSGKSTLLNLIGLLDEPTSGRVLLAGKDMTSADAESRAIARNRIIGFVFQSFNLLPRLDALDNVTLPLLYRGIPQPQARQAALMQLERVGLTNHRHHRPADMSGGQRQRVAIARALVGEPSLLLADEPTGNLDSQTAQDIIERLLSLNRECGTTLVVVTHDTGIADRMARCIQVHDGRLEEAGHA